VLRQHARGGLGRIYVARDEQLGREVALKEIHPEHADDSTSRSRFLLEAEVSGCLEHPGIVPVYALGRYEDGRPYYAMRFIRGKSLREVAIELHERSNPGAADGRSFVLAVRPLVRCLIDVCNAMAYAHCRGVIHRDLKPANIMLGPYGETMIVDWGLAKVLKSTPGDTREAAGSEERARSNVAHAVEEALAQDREAWVPRTGGRGCGDGGAGERRVQLGSDAVHGFDGSAAVR
jgi:serine/threonine protein kinase